MVEVMMDLEQARQLLCARLQKHLEYLEAPLRDDLKEALALDGKLLHQPTVELDGRWALLPFCLAQEIGRARCGDPIQIEAACDVALAMECVICATDLLDDVMDDDATRLIEQLGIPRVLNAALALVSLSQRMLLALLDLNLPVTLPTRLMDLVQCAILQASAGQQQDLLAERRLADSLTRAECLEIASAKSGSLLRLACQMGALCAGVGEAELEVYAEAGRLLGIAAQLDNDAHDLHRLLQSGEKRVKQKSDLARGKKTLPVVLAAHIIQDTHALNEQAIDFKHLGVLVERGQASVLCALREGIISTWGFALLYRERAREQLVLALGEHVLSPMLCQVLGLDYALAEMSH